MQLQGVGVDVGVLVVGMVTDVVTGGEDGKEGGD